MAQAFENIHACSTRVTFSCTHKGTCRHTCRRRAATRQQLTRRTSDRNWNRSCVISWQRFLLRRTLRFGCLRSRKSMTCSSLGPCQSRLKLKACRSNLLRNSTRSALPRRLRCKPLAWKSCTARCRPRTKPYERCGALLQALFAMWRRFA